MTRRLSTLLLSLTFLLSAFHLDYAQPLDASSSDAKPDAGEVSPIAAEPDTNNNLPKLDRPASLAGEPKWMTSDIIHKPQGPKVQTGPQVSATDKPVANPNPTKPDKPIPARPIRDDVALFGERKRTLTKRYRRLAGTDLYFTSGQRTARQQAIAIRLMLRRYGIRYVMDLYRSKQAIGEIVEAYRLNRRNGRSISAMTRVIEDQVSRGICISNHLRWRAVDVRSRGWHRARLSVLRQVARSMGARVSVEPNHYHVDLV